jgi:hypothetical protein
MFKYFFYDKWAIDHRYSNILTRGVTINDITGDIYSLLYSGRDAITFYKNKFGINCGLPLDLLDYDICDIKIYGCNVFEVDTLYTIIGINKYVLEKYVNASIDNKEIPLQIFISQLIRYHMNYTNFNNNNLAIEKIMIGQVEYNLYNQIFTIILGG